MIEFGNIYHGELIAKQYRSTFNPYAETVVSRSENGVCFGGVIYEAYNGCSLGIHVAGLRPNWVNRDLLWTGFAYPFLQLQCKVIIGRVPSTNEDALKFDLHLGFKIVYTIKDAVPNGDLHIIEMRREECKWLKMQPKKIRVINHTLTRKSAA